MSIPLDRLYHYIESLCGDDIIIYRWLPHGSKNLNDLTALNTVYHPYNTTVSLTDFLTSLPIICHDQEPLTFECCTNDEYNNLIKEQFDYHKTSFPAKIFVSELKKQMHIYRIYTSPMSFYDQVLLCNSEKNSIELDKFEANGFIGVYYWSHALIARDWFRYAEYDTLSNPDFDFDYDFLIYNRAWSGTREYRLKFAELLVDNNLLHTSNVKFNPVDNDIHYTQHKFENQKFIINNNKLDQMFELNTTSSSYSADYNGNDYKNSGIEVVLETLFDDSRLHLTEKSLRPIACGKPFILAATAHSLQYLRDYGFKTFNGLIDESYDSIQDPLERLTAIIAELKRISNLPADKKQHLWKELHNIAQYNKNLFFSKEWESSITDELKSNLTAAIIKATQYCTGKYWRQVFTEFKDERGSTSTKQYLDNWLSSRGHRYSN